MGDWDSGPRTLTHMDQGVPRTNRNLGLHHDRAIFVPYLDGQQRPPNGGHAYNAVFAS